MAIMVVPAAFINKQSLILRLGPSKPKVVGKGYVGLGFIRRIYGLYWDDGK